MKTNFFKKGIPIMVFTMAIVFAFASEKTPSKNESLLISGYIFENEVCKSAMDCNNIGNLTCEQGTFQVYKTNLGDTACIEKLTHRP